MSNYETYRWMIDVMRRQLESATTCYEEYQLALHDGADAETRQFHMSRMQYWLDRAEHTKSLIDEYEDVIELKSTLEEN